MQSYDDAGRLEETTRPGPSSSPSQPDDTITTEIIYDSAGRVTDTTEQSSESSETIDSKFGYVPGTRLPVFATVGAVTNTWRYDGAGRAVSLGRASDLGGTLSGDAQVSIGRWFDGAGRIVREETIVAPPSADFDSWGHEVAVRPVSTGTSPTIPSVDVDIPTTVLGTQEVFRVDGADEFQVDGWDVHGRAEQIRYRNDVLELHREFDGPWLVDSEVGRTESGGASTRGFVRKRPSTAAVAWSGIDGKQDAVASSFTSAARTKRGVRCSSLSAPG